MGKCSRCLTDFAIVMDSPLAWSDARDFFLDIAVDAWRVYQKLKGEQTFSRLTMCQRRDHSW